MTCVCGSKRFVFYQRITEAADVHEIAEDGTVFLDDPKWEQTECHFTEVCCAKCYIPLPEWNGEVEEWSSKG